MKQVRGFWLPDAEDHFVSFLENGPEFAAGPTYQLRKLLTALPHVKNFRHVVDVGAHCGMWSRPLSRMFAKLTAFEPLNDNVECFVRNVSADGCVVALHQVALGEKAGNVNLHTNANSTGDTYVKHGGEHQAEMRTLDSFNLTEVDLIKIDCEGYESFILQGGEKTIRRDKPFVIVEQKPNKGAGNFGIADDAACQLLKYWGAREIFVLSGDYGFMWGTIAKGM